MTTLVEQQKTRNKVLEEIFNKKGAAFSLHEIRAATLTSPTTAKTIVYRLKIVSYLIRHRNGYQYKVWQATGLMPTSLTRLIESYEEILETRIATRERIR